MALTISGFLSSALAVWGIDFFKQAFDLSPTKAGAFVPVIGGGAVLGLIGGGELADFLLRRGVANARVYVTAVFVRARERLPATGVPHSPARARRARCCSSAASA